MEDDSKRLDELREAIRLDLNGDNGDDAQEDRIISLFEAHLDHQIKCMNIWAGNGVGVIGNKEFLIWS